MNNLTEKKYYPIDAYYSYKDNKLYYIVKEVDKNGNSKKLVGYKDDPEYSIGIGKFSKNIKYIESLDNKIKDLKLTYKEYNYLKRSLVKAYDGKKNLKAAKKFTEILSHQYDIYDDYRIETKFLQQEIFRYDNDYLNSIKIGVWDIEVYHDDKEFPEPEHAKYTINSISHIDVQNNEIQIYFLYNEQHHSNIENFEEKVYEKLKEEYGLEFSYKLHIFKTEQDLLINYLNYISKFDVMIGWNSLNFDTLYVYNRCKNLKILKHFENSFGEIYQTLNIVDSKNGMNSYTYYTTKILSIDYIHLIKFYDKTNYPSYSLNKIAEKILKKSEDSIIAKIEVQNLNVEYLSNPINFINYNVGDVIINKFIDDKLLFIRILFKQKMMTRGFTAATLSINNILDAYISTEAKKNNKMCISAIKVQNFYTKKIWYIYRRLNFLTDTRLELIQKIREDNKTFSLFTNVNELEEINYDISSFSEKDLEDVNNIKLSKSQFPFIWEQDKYPGAYVKKPNKGIHLNVIDFDASLPPWEYIYIKRNNNINKVKIGEYKYVKGDLTLTCDNNNKSCWKNVLGKTEHNWNDKLVKIKTETGKEISVTNNHSMFGIKKGNRQSRYSLIDAGNLNKGDYLIGIKSFESEGTIKSTNPELIGFWLSDGWKHGNSYYISKQDKELLEIFYPYIYDIRVKKKENNKHKTEYVGKIREDIAQELNNFYEHSKKKNFLYILNYNKGDRKRIWEGMLFADGTLLGLNSDSTKTPVPFLCKYRKEEKDECFIVAHSIDWKPICRKNGIKKSVIRKGDIYTRYPLDNVPLEVYGSEKGYAAKLRKLNMGGSCRYNMYKIEKELPYIKNSFSDDIGLEKIKEIEYIDYVGKVYDISVKETERFIGGTGICAHNTSMYPSSIYSTNNGCDSWVYQVPENLALLYLYEREKFYLFVNENENLTIEIYDVINDKFKQFKHFEIIEIFDKIFEKELVLTETGAVFIPAHIEESFFRKLIKFPISDRQVIKKEMNDKIKNEGLLSDDPEIINLNITQLVDKIIANCFTGDTDFINTKGICNIKDAKIGTNVYNVNPITNKVEIDKIIDIQEYNYNDYIYNFSNTQGLDLSVTKGHRFLVNSNRENNVWKTATEIYNSSIFKIPKIRGYNYKTNNNEFISLYNYILKCKEKYGFNYDVVITSNLHLRKFESSLSEKLKIILKEYGRYNNKRYFISIDKITESNLNELNIKSTKLEVMRRFNKGGKNSKLPIFINKKYLHKLLAYYITEGSLYERWADNELSTLMITITKYSIEVKENIKNICNNIGINCSINKKEVRICNDVLYSFIEETCGKGSYNKKIPNFILNSSIDIKKDFFNILNSCDGNKNSKRYNTVSKYLVNDLIILLTSLGYFTKYKKEKYKDRYIYRIVWYNKNVKLDNRINKTKEQYNGKVYCVTTEKNKNIFAGRNGKFITVGQSVYGYLGFRKSRLFNIILATTITMNCQFMIRYVAINSDRIVKNINDVE
jgi:intein/homing endonuclease